uniref:Hypothetical membrane protein n=1 Tax=uncultured virus TaxID=340016 RepID=D5L2D0_9VIRU|nr:hypothetical membrane protein [uncultured virus]
MNWRNWWIPLFALFGFAVVLPPWGHFISTYTSNLPIEGQFFAALVLPVLAALFVASWIDPGGAA